MPEIYYTKKNTSPFITKHVKPKFILFEHSESNFNVEHSVQSPPGRRTNISGFNPDPSERPSERSLHLRR